MRAWSVLVCMEAANFNDVWPLEKKIIHLNVSNMDYMQIDFLGYQKEAGKLLIV